MAIYTSYYAKLRNLPDTITPISISRGVPEWYNGFTYPPLAPEWEIVAAIKNGTITWEEYDKRYRADTLSKLNPQLVAKQLNAFGQDVALLCYEKTQCHRFIVCSWFNENGIECKEWDGIPLGSNAISRIPLMLYFIGITVWAATLGL